MGSGLSMTSVNKIKELAESREYNLAVDILDSQDLSKSLNPQFLRLCGMIYTEKGRYVDARRVLLMAHRLAPEAKRIMYSLIYLYLKMGYRSLAQTYYDIYMSDADVNNIETKQVIYIMNKAERKEPDELLELIAQTYSNTIDYDWTYEVILLYLVAGKRENALVLFEDYKATYKNEANSIKLQSVLDGNEKAEDYLYLFNSQILEDDDAEQEQLRQEEAKLLEADELRIHPKEAEIIIMVDDNDEVEIGSKRKLKKYLKEQEKLKKLEENAPSYDEDRENGQIDGKEAENANSDGGTETKQIDDKDSEASTEERINNIETDKNRDANDDENKIKIKGAGFIKKIFKKSKNKEDNDLPEEVAEAEAETEEVTETEAEAETEEATEAEAEAETEEVTEAEAEAETEEVTEAEDEDETETEEAAEAEIDGEINDNVTNDSDILDEIQEKSDEDLDMREIHLNQHTRNIKPSVSVEFGNDFTAQSDTIDELRDDNDFSNPFDSISAYRKDNAESEENVSTKMKMIFEEAGLSSEDYELDNDVDDFSIGSDDEFGEMSIADDLVNDDRGNDEEFSFKDDEFFSKIETEIRENDSRLEDEAQTEIAAEDEAAEDHEEPEAAEDEAAEDHEEPEAVEEEVAEDHEEPEEIEDEATEDHEDPEEIEDEAIDVYEEPETVEVDEVAEEHSDSTEESVEENSEITANCVDSYTDKTDYSLGKNIDFPVFKSSLFPNHNNKVTEVENNFSEVMIKAQDKMNENLLREEQMQREAEALLASLGIDLGSVSSTPAKSSIQKLNTVSRKELMESLKLDSNQKNILKKLKEYR